MCVFCGVGGPTIYAWWKPKREYLVILLGNWLTDLRISGDRTTDFQWSLRFIESRKQTNSLKILKNLSLAPALTFLTVSLLVNLPFPALCVTPFLTSQFTLTSTSFPPYLFSYISPSLIFLVVSRILLFESGCFWSKRCYRSESQHHRASIGKRHKK